VGDIDYSTSLYIIDLIASILASFFAVRLSTTAARQEKLPQGTMK